MATINIFGIIGSDVRAQDIVKQLTEVNKGTEAEPVNVNIMSDGGDVVEGLTIFNALRRLEAVNVHVEFAASIAATIAMAGTTITMAENGRLMIHNPFAGIVADAEDMRRMADRLDGAKTDIIRSFSRTGLSESEISAMMDKETFLNAAEALRLGFIDAIAEPSKMVATLDKSSLLAWKNEKQNEDNMVILEKIKSYFGNELDESLKAKADELAKLNAEVAERKAELDEDEKATAEQKAKDAITAELKAAGKLTAAMIESTWMQTQSADSLKAYGESAPKLVAVADPVKPDAEEPADEIKVDTSTDGLAKAKFNTTAKGGPKK